jgi:hypothetical protein
MGRWDELVGRLSVTLPYGGERKTSTTEDIERFEAEFGLAMPASYRDYVRAVGPGNIGPDGAHIYAPGFPQSPTNDLGTDCRQWREEIVGGRSDEDLAGSYGDGARARRLVRFGCVLGIGFQFAWDTGEVVDPEGHEYGVYLIDPDRFGAEAVVKVAPTFAELVTEFILGHGYATYYYGETPEGPTEWTSGEEVYFAQVIEPPPEPRKPTRARKKRR